MSWKIDPAHSLIEFSAKHLMITTVRGQFTRFDGSVNLDDEKPGRSVIEGWVEAASLDTHEPKRDGHLRSPDFFDVEKYPRITFHSKKITHTRGERYKLLGDLTIKETTREIVFDVTYEGESKDPWGSIRRAFTADATLNRKDFGLNWNVALETGGWLVGDQVKIHCELEVASQPDS